MTERDIEPGPEVAPSASSGNGDGAPAAPEGNIAARMAHWSSQHRKRAIFGWLAFVLVAFAADGMGLSFVPTVVASTAAARYGLAEVGRVDAVKERFYAISAERRLVHPGVRAIRDAARSTIFA